jgi:hypothetical protein
MTRRKSESIRRGGCVKSLLKLSLNLEYSWWEDLISISLIPKIKTDVTRKYLSEAVQIFEQCGEAELPLEQVKGRLWNS